MDLHHSPQCSQSPTGLNVSSMSELCRALEEKGHYKCLVEQSQTAFQGLAIELEKSQAKVKELYLEIGRLKNCKSNHHDIRLMVDASTITDTEDQNCSASEKNAHSTLQCHDRTFLYLSFSTPDPVTENPIAAEPNINLANAKSSEIFEAMDDQRFPAFFTDRPSQIDQLAQLEPNHFCQSRPFDKNCFESSFPNKIKVDDNDDYDVKILSVIEESDFNLPKILEVATSSIGRIRKLIETQNDKNPDPTSNSTNKISNCVKVCEENAAFTDDSSYFSSITLGVKQIWFGSVCMLPQVDCVRFEEEHFQLLVIAEPALMKDSTYNDGCAQNFFKLKAHQTCSFRLRWHNLKKIEISCRNAESIMFLTVTPECAEKFCAIFQLPETFKVHSHRPYFNPQSSYPCHRFITIRFATPDYDWAATLSQMFRKKSIPIEINSRKPVASAQRILRQLPNTESEDPFLKPLPLRMCTRRRLVGRSRSTSYKTIQDASNKEHSGSFCKPQVSRKVFPGPVNDDEEQRVQFLSSVGKIFKKRRHNRLLWSKIFSNKL